METNDPKPTHFSLKPISGPEDHRRFSRLLDRSFQVPLGHRFLDDFPVWDETFAPAENRIMRFGAFGHDGRLVACAAVRLAELKAAHNPLPIAVIGAVATEEGSRGHGLASHLVSLASEWAKNKGAAAAFLWGSEHSLYQRQGFELCGTQVRVALGDLELEPNRLETLGTDWTPELFSLVRERPGGLELQPSDFPWMEAHRNVKWFWLGPKAAPLAYAALGRGIDLAGIIHEWGGERRALKILLATLKQLYPDSSLLGPVELLAAFGLLSERPLYEGLCLARVLDPARIFQSHYPDVPFRSRAENGAFQISLAGLPEISLTDLELSRLFFGSPPSNPAANLGSNSVHQTSASDVLGKFSRASYFPLSFWIWGLDAA